jgi:hypothetical protein
VYGEIELPITVGPHEFKVTFQIMEIQASFSCLLGRPWIHNAGAVTSTLHQKLKFISQGKFITVNGEVTLLVSHLSSFSFIVVIIQMDHRFKDSLPKRMWKRLRLVWLL